MLIFMLISYRYKPFPLELLDEFEEEESDKSDPVRSHFPPSSPLERSRSFIRK